MVSQGLVLIDYLLLDVFSIEVEICFFRGVGLTILRIKPVSL